MAMNKLGTLLLIAVSVTPPAFAAPKMSKVKSAPTRVDPAEEMLNYFSSTCRSQGAWTKAALGKASALVATLRAIKDSPECNAMVGNSGRLNILEEQVQTIADMTSDTRQLLRNRSIEQSILFQLTTATDPFEQSQLRSQLSSAQIEISALETDQKSRNTLTADEQTRILSSIAQHTDQFLINASNNQSCMMKNAGLLSDVARLTGGVLSTLTAVNPALSLGIAGGTQLLSKTLDAARNYRLNRKIRKMNQANDIAAMSCVLESLSTDYCHADDALRAFDWKTQNGSITDNPPAGSLRAAIRLMDRELPSLIAYLDSIRTSAVVSTLRDGERVKEFFARDALLQGTLPIARGLFAERSLILNAIPREAPDAQRWKVVKDTLTQLMTKIGGSSGSFEFNTSATAPTNPLFGIYSQNNGLFNLVGIPEAQIPRDFNRAVSFSEFDFSQWPTTVPKPVFDETLLPTIFARLVDWHQLALQQLGSERRQIVNPDGLNTLTMCGEKNSNESRVAPCTALTRLREFLDLRLKDTGMSKSFRRLHLDTRDRLAKMESVMANLETVAMPTEDELSGALSQIYTLARLEYGTFFMKGRFDSLLRIAFTDLFEQQDPRDASIAAQSLASAKFMDALERIKVGAGRTEIRVDIETSLALNQTTLDKFVDTFGEQISDVLVFLRDAEGKNLPTAGSTIDKSISFRNQRAMMCLNLLNASTWPRTVDQRLCVGMNLRMLPPQGPISDTVSEALMASTSEKRMCRMRDAKRASDIFEFQQR